MKTSETPKWKRRLLILAVVLGACALTIAIFYAEEDLRGWKAMRETRQKLAAEGIDLDWNKEIPAPVPEDQNVFGVPEMQRWFTGRGTNELGRVLSYQPAKVVEPFVITRLIIALPEISIPAAAATVTLGDSNAPGQIDRLIKVEFGPVALDPLDSFFFTTRDPGEIQPIQVFVRCQTTPKRNEMATVVPQILRSFGSDSQIRPQLQTNLNGGYDLTIDRPPTAGEYLRWTEQFQPKFNLIKNALGRPFARFNGNYDKPEGMTIPAFVTMRAVAQRLSSKIRCECLLGRSQEAVDDLVFLNDLCRRVLVDNQPMTLISAMINVAIKGLYASTIADCIEMRAWNEEQLAAVENILTPLNVLTPVDKSLRMEKKLNCMRLATMTPTELHKLFVKYKMMDGPLNAALFRLMPRGWVWQNMATAYRVSYHGSMDPVAKLSFPFKNANVAGWSSHWSPYTFIAAMGVPNFLRACQTTAMIQTEIQQAAIVCALERYKLAEAKYPGSLDALIPKFIASIPHDVVGGKPPYYHLDADGTFTLYSIGWDEKDHGGAREPDPNHDHGGNIVWPPN